MTGPTDVAVTDVIFVYGSAYYIMYSKHARAARGPLAPALFPLEVFPSDVFLVGKRGEAVNDRV